VLPKQENTSESHRGDRVSIASAQPSGWLSGFLPLRAGDLETIKDCVRFSTPEQMEAFAHLEVGVDLALLGDLEAATAEFDAALKLEQGLDYRRLVQNRMQSVANLVKMPESSQAWLVDRRKMLE